jgi:hypothetical protein
MVKLEKVIHSVEDVDNLLSTLLTLDTFIVGFAITFLSGISYSDMIEADFRFFSTYPALDPKINSFWGGVDGNGTHFVMSASLAFRCWMSITFLSVSLFITIGCVIGLNYSNCREDKDEFDSWISYFRFFILIGYILFMVGFMYLYASVGLLAYANLPKYCELSTKAWGVYGPDTMYNASMGSLTEGCVVQSMNLWQGSAQITALNVLCPTIIVLLFGISLYLGGFKQRAHWMKTKGVAISSSSELDNLEDSGAK